MCVELSAALWWHFFVCMRGDAIWRKKVHRLNKKGPSHDDDDGVQHHITASPYILHQCSWQARDLSTQILSSHTAHIISILSNS